MTDRDRAPSRGSSRSPMRSRATARPCSSSSRRAGLRRRAKPGAAMVVSRSAVHGTIGGGHLEFEAMRIARDALADEAPSGTWIVRFPLAARLGQCCGGVATLAFSKVDRRASAWIEPASACARTGAPFALVTRIARRRATRHAHASSPPTTRAARSAASSSIRRRSRLPARGSPARRPRRSARALRQRRPGHAADPGRARRPFSRCWLFGNGHVGRALVSVLGVVARARAMDRFARSRLPATRSRRTSRSSSPMRPKTSWRTRRTGAFVVVTTHSHALDLALIEAALARDDWRYLGLIGSRSKRAQFERRLAARGLRAEALARIRCPIGDAGRRRSGASIPARSRSPSLRESLVVREASAHRADAPRSVGLVRATADGPPVVNPANFLSPTSAGGSARTPRRCSAQRRTLCATADGPPVVNPANFLWPMSAGGES